MRQGGRAIETTQTSGVPFEGTELIKQTLVLHFDHLEAWGVLIP